MGQFANIPKGHTEKRRWQLKHPLQATGTNPHRAALVALYSGYEAGKVTQYIAIATCDRKYSSHRYTRGETFESFTQAIANEPDYQEILPGSRETFLV